MKQFKALRGRLLCLCLSLIIESRQAYDGSESQVAGVSVGSQMDLNQYQRLQKVEHIQGLKTNLADEPYVNGQIDDAVDTLERVVHPKPASKDQYWALTGHDQSPPLIAPPHPRRMQRRSASPTTITTQPPPLTALTLLRIPVVCSAARLRVRRAGGPHLHRREHVLRARPRGGVQPEHHRGPMPGPRRRLLPGFRVFFVFFLSQSSGTAHPP